ncbi:MAG: hypothetical protein R3261_04360, partial [Alphaproteobacteria bacterium]|nr:hypothetical protein [Alphaproteobacteria bacterium]
KPDDDTQEQAQSEEAKRFIIETSFQSMGPLQLDGLATKTTIDLMFRSLSPVDKELRDEIRSIFGDTITALGLTGTIRFHVADSFPVSFPVEQTNLGNQLTI